MSEIDAGIVEKVARAMNPFVFRDNLQVPPEDVAAFRRSAMEKARDAITAYEAAKAQERAAHVSDLSATVNAVHGEAMQELASGFITPTARERELEDALMPFVELISEFEDADVSGGDLKVYVNHGDVLRARAVMERVKG